MYTYPLVISLMVHVGFKYALHLSIKGYLELPQKMSIRPS